MTSQAGISRRALLAGLSTLPACSPLGLVNAINPVEPGGRLAASGIAYGDDPRQRLDVYAPQVSERPAPVAVFLYGGGWSSGERAEYAFVGQALAARGFVTVVPDSRLVPQVRFPTFLEDCARAVRWTQDTVASHGGDGRRIMLCGHSAGAYNAVMLGLDRRYLARAGVRPGLVTRVAGLAGPYDFLPFDVVASREAFGRWPRPAETQPVNFAGGATARFFLATGDADETVKPRNTAALAARLRQAGKSVETRTYPGIGHPGILLALGPTFRSRAPVLDDLVRFANG